LHFAILVCQTRTKIDGGAFDFRRPTRDAVYLIEIVEESLDAAKRMDAERCLGAVRFRNGFAVIVLATVYAAMFGVSVA
jgi:hypothetical protein